MIRGLGFRVWSGNSFRVEGSSMEMWKMGWILLIKLGRQRVKETEPTWAIISKGPRYFSASFIEGWVVQILLDLMKTLSLILKSDGRV